MKGIEKAPTVDLLRRNTLKGHCQHWDRADLDTSFLTLKKSSLQPEIKVHVEFCFCLHSVLLDFQLFTEKPVFECAFAHPIMLFLSYFVKNSMGRVPVICKSSLKWYLMRMCGS